MIECLICGHQADKSIQAHLKVKHNITPKQYLKEYPGTKIFSEELMAELNANNRAKNIDPMFRSKVSTGLKKLWEDPDYKAQQVKKMAESRDTPEVKQKRTDSLNNYFKGRTPEQIQAAKDARKAFWADPVKRANMVAALKAAHNTPEAKERHKEATKKFYAGLTEEQRQDVRDNLSEAWAKPKNREKILELSKIGLEAANTPEGRKNHALALAKPETRENMRKAQNRPEVRERMSQTAIKNLIKGNYKSKLSIRFGKALNAMGLVPQEEHPVNHYVVDFCFPLHRVIVEVDGDYWHGNPSIYETFNLYRKKIGLKTEEKLLFVKIMAGFF